MNPTENLYEPHWQLPTKEKDTVSTIFNFEIWPISVEKSIWSLLHSWICAPTAAWSQPLFQISWIRLIAYFYQQLDPGRSHMCSTCLGRCCKTFHLGSPTFKNICKSVLYTRVMVIKIISDLKPYGHKNQPKLFDIIIKF